MVNDKLLAEVINKQFQMIDAPITFESLPEDSIIILDKKRRYWYDVFKFKSVEQWMEWRKWMETKIEREDDRLYIDLRWGMSYEIEKGSS